MKKKIFLLVLITLLLVISSFSVLGVLYNISASPLAWNGTNYDGLGGAGSGMYFITFSQNATHLINLDNTTINPSTNGTIGGYNFHIALINSSIGNTTVLISQGQFITNQSGYIFTQNCTGVEDFFGMVLPGAFGGNVTCNNFKYGIFTNTTASGGFYTFGGFTNFTSAGTVTEVNNSNFTPSTNPFIQADITGTMAISFAAYTFGTRNYTNSLGGPEPSALFFPDSAQPVEISADKTNISYVNGSENINMAILNLTGEGFGNLTVFFAASYASNCSDLGTQLSVAFNSTSGNSCDRFITNFFIANGFNRNYTYNTTALTGQGINLSSGLTNPPYFYAVFPNSNAAPSVPTLHLPTNNTVLTYNTTIALNWSNSTDTDNNPITYQIQVASDSAFTALAYINSGVVETTNTTGVTITTLSNGTYYWRVLANDGTTNSSFSPIRTFNVTVNNAPTPPTLHLPANLTVLSYNTSIVLNWSNTTDPDGNAISYLVLVSNTSSFTDLFYSNTSVSETTNVTGVTISALANGQYYWKVLAKDSSLNSSFSVIRTFNVSANAAPGAPTLHLPENATSYAVGTTSVALNWSNTTDPNSNPITYIVEVSTDIAFGSFTYFNGSVPETTNVTGVTVSSLSAGTYYWRVLSTDNSSNSSYSTIRYFSIASASSGGSGGGSSNRGGGVSTGIKIDVDFMSITESTVSGQDGFVKHFRTTDGENHTLTFTDVGDSNVTLKVQSEPQTVILELSQSKRVDIDSDGADDVRMTLDSIHNGVANVTLVSLHEIAQETPSEEQVVEEAPLEEVPSQETPAPNVLDTPEPVNESLRVKILRNTSLIIRIVAGIAVLVIIGAAIYAGTGRVRRRY